MLLPWRYEEVEGICALIGVGSWIGVRTVIDYYGSGK